jgi:hypothetical protein
VGGRDNADCETMVDVFLAVVLQSRWSIIEIYEERTATCQRERVSLFMRGSIPQRNRDAW